MERTNPLHKAADLEITRRLVERFGFLKFPQTHQDFNDTENGIAFAKGASDGFEIQELKFFPNGFVVNMGDSTRHAEKLLDGIAGIFRDAGLLSPSDFVTDRIYASQLVFRSDIDVLDVNAKITALVEKTFSKKPTGVAALGFYTNGNIEATSVRIERLAGVPATAMQFWSQAPVQTDEHLRFLQEYEQLLA